MGKVIIDFLNVGFGECIVIRHIGDYTYTVVIDGGDDRQFIYEKNNHRIHIKTYLELQGIKKIDLLVMTHPHRDHIGGIKEIIKSYPIDEVWCPFYVPFKVIKDYGKMREENMIESLEIYKMLIHHFEQQVGSNLRVIEESLTCKLGNIHIEMFSPIMDNIHFIQDKINLIYADPNKQSMETMLSQIDKNLNACSLVNSITCNGKKVLLTADIGLDYWKPILSKKKLNADILKAPHHGDREYLSEEYLKLVNPTHIVVCADDEYTYELPSIETHQFIKNVLPHSNVLYTAENKEAPEKIHRGIRLEIDTDGTVHEKQL